VRGEDFKHVLKSGSLLRRLRHQAPNQAFESLRGLRAVPSQTGNRSVEDLLELLGNRGVLVVGRAPGEGEDSNPPMANRSEAAPPSRADSTCSGAMKSGVPSGTPVPV
jgi:hypothetical protein